LSLLGLYFAAMAASAIGSTDPRASAVKLLIELYLLGLPVLSFNVVRTMPQLRCLVLAWTVAAAAVAATGVVTLLLFPVLGRHSILSVALHNFGTLPPGPYPRLELTFLYPAMLANYLGVALLLVLAAARIGWIRHSLATLAAAAILASAFFALTPGFGGILWMLAMWFWYCNRETRPGPARAACAAGWVIALLAVLASTASPIAESNPPFLIELPALSQPLAPSVRLLAWIDAARTFLSAPLLGQGIGTKAVDVSYFAGGCGQGCVTDAHNMFLSIAAQSGALGLAALLAIVVFVARGVSPRSEPLDFALSTAWIGGFAVEGLVGSFEDARHLWLLFGLVLCARTAPPANSKSAPSSLPPRRDRQAAPA
jgi:O-antigen ligase